jgi:hypothetical protein
MTASNIADVFARSFRAALRGEEPTEIIQYAAKKKNPDLQQPSLFETSVQPKLDDLGPGRWITIHSGDDNKGGHRVYIGDDGKMKTGRFAGQSMTEAFSKSPQKKKRLAKRGDKHEHGQGGLFETETQPTLPGIGPKNHADVDALKAMGDSFDKNLKGMKGRDPEKSEPHPLQAEIDEHTRNGVQHPNSKAILDSANEYVKAGGKPRYRGEDVDHARGLREIPGNEARVKRTNEITGREPDYLIPPAAEQSKAESKAETKPPEQPKPTAYEKPIDIGDRVTFHDPTFKGIKGKDSGPKVGTITGPAESQGGPTAYDFHVQFDDGTEDDYGSEELERLTESPSAEPAAKESSEQPPAKGDYPEALPPETHPIVDAVRANGGHEKNSANDVDAIRNALYKPGGKTPTHAEIRGVMQEMKNAGREADDTPMPEAKPAAKPGIELPKPADNTSAKAGDQLGLFGEVKNVKSDKAPSLKPGGESKGKAQSLFDTTGNADQMDLFGDGVMDDSLVYKPEQDKNIVPTKPSTPHDEAIDRAGKYRKHGEEYDRTVSDRAARLESAKSRGHGPAMLDHLTSELNASIDALGERKSKLDAGKDAEKAPKAPGKAGRESDGRFNDPYSIKEERPNQRAGSLSDHDSALIDLQTAHDQLERAKKEKDDSLKFVEPGSYDHKRLTRRADDEIATAERAKVRAFNKFTKHADRLAAQSSEPESSKKKVDVETSEAASQDGPQEGDRNESGLVLRNGRWRREGDEETAPEAKSKQPWEMTKAEHTQERSKKIDKFKSLVAENGGLPGAMSNPEVAKAFRDQEEWGDIDIGHRPAVAKALKDGKAVPESVLAEYPKLKAPEAKSKSVPVSEFREKMGHVRDALNGVKSAVGDKEKSRATESLKRTAGELAGMSSANLNDIDKETFHSLLDESGWDGDRADSPKKLWQKTAGELRDSNAEMGKMERSDGTGQKGLIEKNAKMVRDHKKAVEDAVARGENVPDDVLKSAGVEKPAPKKNAEWDSGKGKTALSIDKGFSFWKDGVPYSHAKSSETTNLAKAAEHLAENGGDSVSVNFRHGGDKKLSNRYMDRLHKLADAAGYEVGEEHGRTIGEHEQTGQSVVTLTKSKTNSKATAQENATQAQEKAAESGATPREAANIAQKQLDADYQFARASEIGNAGEDLKGSARHKVNAWKGLKEAEESGSAAEMMTRKNLLKIEPHNLYATMKPETSMSHLASHLALSAFPESPGDYSDKVKETGKATSSAEQLRQQYFDTYKAIKAVAEKHAQESADPKEALDAIGREVFKHINTLRGLPANPSSMDFLNATDRYNPIANGLIPLYNRTRGNGRKKTDFMARVKEFANLSAEKFGDKPSKDHLEFMASAAKDLMDGKSMNKIFDKESKKQTRFNPTDAYVGHAERKGGRDLTSVTSDPQKAVDHMVNTMGLRGVQWGNSVTDDERKHHAARAAEALTDLADVLGIHPKDVALDGRLGLAIGARGRSGAAAHYEPGTKVINLTRANGVGTLAHEWGHAFDHMLNDYGITKDKKNGTFMSGDTNTHTITRPERGSGDWSSTTSKPEHMKSMGYTVTPREKSEMRSRYQKLEEAGKPYRERLRGELQKLVNNKEMSAKKANDYWNSPHEIFARTFEQHVQRKLKSEGKDNTYLAGLGGTGGGLWPTPEESDQMADAFDAIFEEYRKGKHGKPDRIKFSAAEAAAVANFWIERYAGKDQMAFDWIEEDHPREPAGKGNGGQFTASKSSASKAVSAGESSKFLVKGTTDSETRCERCGRSDLKKTVCIEHLDAEGNKTGDFHYYGSDCASKITGKRQATIEKQAAEADYRKPFETQLRMRRIAEDKGRANLHYNMMKLPKTGSYLASNEKGDWVRVDGSDLDDVAFWEEKGFEKKTGTIQEDGTVEKYSARDPGDYLSLVSDLVPIDLVRYEWNASAHPREAAGKSTGGQFTKGNRPGGSLSPRMLNAANAHNDQGWVDAMNAPSSKGNKQAAASAPLSASPKSLPSRKREIAQVPPTVVPGHALHLSSLDEGYRAKLLNWGERIFDLSRPMNSTPTSKLSNEEQAEAGWAKVDKNAIRGMLAEMNQMDKEARANGVNLSDFVNANQIVPRNLAERLDGGSRFFDPEKIRSKLLTKPQRPAPKPAEPAAERPISPRLLNNFKTGDRDDRARMLQDPQTRESIERAMGLKPSGLSPKAPPAEAKLETKATTPAPAAKQKPKQAAKPKPEQAEGLSSQADRKLNAAVMEAVGGNLSAANHLKSIAIQAWKGIRDQAEQHNEAYDGILSFFDSAKMDTRVMASGKAIKAKVGENRNPLLKAIRSGADPSTIPGFDEMIDFAKREYPAAISRVHGESETGSAEDGLLALLKEGRMDIPSPYSDEVLDRASEMAGANFWESLQNPEYDDDAEVAAALANSDHEEEIPFSSRRDLTAALIRYWVKGELKSVT